MTRLESLTILNRSVPSGTHICAFFSGPAERDEIVMPFLAEGIRAGQKCICILESLGPADVLARLGRQVDLGRSVETGQLELATPATPTCARATFSTEDMLSYWQQAAAAAQSAEGLRPARATGKCRSVLNQPAGRRSSSATRPGSTRSSRAYPQVIFCLYDLERFGAEVLMDTLRTHPHGGRGRDGAREPVLRRAGQVPRGRR